MARLNIAPTKSNLLTLRRDLAVAKEGFSLLDQKREILVLELSLLMGRARDLQADLGAVQAEALQSLRTAIVRSGADRLTVLAGGVKANHRAEWEVRIVAGVRLPKVSVALAPLEPSFTFTDTDSGLDAVVSLFRRLLELGAALAQLETDAALLAAELKKTQRRVNALEQVFIPTFKDTLHYVSNALESKELESIFTLKLVKTRLTQDRDA